MLFLLTRDINVNGIASNADVTSAKARVGAAVFLSNFRNNVNANGTLSALAFDNDALTQMSRQPKPQAGTTSLP
jgi:hypothetical protein